MTNEGSPTSNEELARLEAKREQDELAAWQEARSGRQEDFYPGLDRGVPWEVIVSFPIAEIGRRDELLPSIEQCAWKFGGLMDHYPEEPAQDSPTFEVRVLFGQDDPVGSFIAKSTAQFGEIGVSVTAPLWSAEQEPVELKVPSRWLDMMTPEERERAEERERLRPIERLSRDLKL